MGCYAFVRPGAGLRREMSKDVLVCGLDHIENLGDGRLRFVLFVEDRKGRRLRRRPAPVDIVMGRVAVAAAVGLTIAELGRAVFVGPDGKMTLQ